MSKIKWGSVSILIVVTLTIWYTVWEFRDLRSQNLTKDKQLLQAQTKIEQLSKLSPIEIDEIDLKTSQLDSEKYAKLEEENKRLKELAVWKTRCLKKKIIWEETDCENNLERYASYNLK